MSNLDKSLILLLAALGLAACSSGERRFPLRDPVWRDTDLDSVRVRCHPEPSPKEPEHVSCAPARYLSPFYWDGTDNLLFRPLSSALAVPDGREAVNVNSLDETPDSAWFTNRLGRRAMTLDELRLGACTPDQILDPDRAADGEWVIHKGKSAGGSVGFRIKVPGKGEYMIKVENLGDQPERQSAAAVIGAAAYHAAGYYAACEQIVYARPAVFKLTPGLVSKDNLGNTTSLDDETLAAIFARSPRRGDKLRLSASSWIKGYGIGPYRYWGTREDDPNDVIPHEDRRDLRGMRLLAAWIGRFDAREGNTFDTWFADAKDGPKDASPGRVVHYQLDESETLGCYMDLGDQIARRLGHSYLLDWGELATDFVTLGAVPRPWDTAAAAPGHELFGYFDVEHFVPERWKSEYSNAAFSRMTERDGAWMARILARFSPATVRALAEMGSFSDPAQTDHLARVLEGRLQRILDRYLTRLSPIADVQVEGDAVCGVDLAELRGVRPAGRFHYRALSSSGTELAVSKRPGARICVALPRAAASDRAPDDAPERYVRLAIEDGVARGALSVHLYDLGPARGFRLAGLERPDR